MKVINNLKLRKLEQCVEEKMNDERLQEKHIWKKIFDMGRISLNMCVRDQKYFSFQFLQY